MKCLIKNGRVIDPASGTDDTLDILIEKGKIAEIKSRIESSNIRTIDASRLVVAPGLIDMHTHLREPGREDKETILTGSRAAAKGGFTSIACMPNTYPVNDNAGVTRYILTEARKTNLVNVFPIAAVSKNSESRELTDMADLVRAGAVAFSDDGLPVADSQIMRRALEYSKPLNKLIIDHCEDMSLSANGVMHEGFYSTLFGLNGIPSSSEEVLVARDIILAEKAETSVHIAHISTKGSVYLLRRAREKGIRVSAEVTPHHLLLDDSLLETYNTNLKVKPPLRNKEDMAALLEAVKEGLIDAFATDHAPHTPDEKNVEFDNAPFGINGLETAVSLLLDKFVTKNILSLEDFIRMFSTNPARLLRLEGKGEIKKGADADLTLLNLRKEILVDPNKFESKSRNTPFTGWKLKGRPEMTIVGGRIVYSARP
ncbi:MAG: dihydroorotase [Candidatus Aminicenantes bacterium]|nr:dihydroorotase [Candidatus Aminicenantes bacterium]